MTYKFKVEARNVIGYSAMSTQVIIVSAIPPAQPSAPVISININNVVITWTAPISTNGSPIISY